MKKAEALKMLKNEIKYQQEQFDLLYSEHFSSERKEDSFYDEMMEDINMSRGKTDLLIRYLE